MANTDEFFEQLQGFSHFADFSHRQLYTELPDDWYVVITDIKGSTKAIQDGKYKEVNSLGAASIVALINAVVPLKVPFVFGGDGSTICVPPSTKGTVESALVATRQMAAKEFQLDLRIGMVPMQVILENQHQVLIAKYQPKPHFQQAMFQGDGLSYAETLVKDPAEDNPYLVNEEGCVAEASFEGFECRWNEIPSPQEETVAILVQVLSEELADKENLYGEISNKILSIYGDVESNDNKAPFQENNLSLTSSLKKLSSEIRIRTFSSQFWQRWIYALRLKLLVNIGKYLMGNNVETDNVNWGNYKKTLIENTDYRKFDEVLRMILSGTVKQREELLLYLENMYQQKQIVFGVHPSPSVLMTCLIFNYDEDHFHFVDGSNGGYAMAAKEMKKQLKALG